MYCFQVVPTDSCSVTERGSAGSFEPAKYAGIPWPQWGGLDQFRHQMAASVTSLTAGVQGGVMARSPQMSRFRYSP